MATALAVICVGVVLAHRIADPLSRFLQVVPGLSLVLIGLILLVSVLRYRVVLSDEAIEKRGLGTRRFRYEEIESILLDDRRVALGTRSNKIVFSYILSNWTTFLNELISQLQNLPDLKFFGNQELLLRFFPSRLDEIIIPPKEQHRIISRFAESLAAWETEVMDECYGACFYLEFSVPYFDRIREHLIDLYEHWPRVPTGFGGTPKKNSEAYVTNEENQRTCQAIRRIMEQDIDPAMLERSAHEIDSALDSIEWLNYYFGE